MTTPGRVKQTTHVTMDLRHGLIFNDKNSTPDAVAACTSSEANVNSSVSQSAEPFTNDIKRGIKPDRIKQVECVVVHPVRGLLFGQEQSNGSLGQIIRHNDFAHTGDVRLISSKACVKLPLQHSPSSTASLPLFRVHHRHLTDILAQSKPEIQTDSQGIPPTVNLAYCHAQRRPQMDIVKAKETKRLLALTEDSVCIAESNAFAAKINVSLRANEESTLSVDATTEVECKGLQAQSKSSDRSTDTFADFRRQEVARGVGPFWQLKERGSTVGQLNKSNEDRELQDSAHALADWTGCFAPPPESWEQRSDFEKADLVKVVTAWYRACAELGDNLNIVHKSVLIDEEALEIAPPSWRPVDIDGLSKDDWWRRHMQDLRKARANPQSLQQIYPSTWNELLIDENDVNKYKKPWWYTYSDVSSYTLSKPFHPWAKLDPKDPVNTRRRFFTVQRSIDMYNKGQRVYGHTITCLKHVNRQRNYTAASSADAASIMGAAHSDAQTCPSPLDHRDESTTKAPLIEQASAWCRPFELHDIDNLAEIRGLATRASCIVDVPNEDPELLRIIASAKRSGLPFVVAGLPGANKPSGYAYATDVGGQHAFLKYTVNIRVMVSPGMEAQMLFKTLLDTLRQIFDCSYTSILGRPINLQDMKPARENGDARLIRTMHVTLYYTESEEWRHRAQALAELGFQRVMEPHWVGRKQAEDWAGLLNIDVFQTVYMAQTTVELPQIDHV